MKGKSILCYVMVALLVGAMVGVIDSLMNPSSRCIISKNRVLLSDTSGPTFDISPMGQLEKQYTRESASLSIPIDLKVDIEDGDLPHTVLAQWKNVSAEIWSESKMSTEMMLSETSFRMTLHLFDYEFNANNTFAAWDFRFAANDSLGNLASSDDFRLSVSVDIDIGAEFQRILSFWVSIATIAIVAVVIVSFPVILIKKLN